MLRNHYFFTYFSAFILFFGFILDIEFVFFLLAIIFFHFNVGLHSILTDYIHLDKLKIIYLSFTRIFFLEILRYFLEILF